MRKLLWATISIVAAALATGVRTQDVDWKVFTEPFVTSAHAEEIRLAEGRRHARPEAGGRRATCTATGFRAAISA